MGLNILLETKNTTPRETCHLSRQFCREMISQAENSDSVINHLITKYKISKTVIDEINVWDLERNFHELSTEIEKIEIEKRYQMAWKKVENILSEIEKLKANFLSDDDMDEAMKKANKHQKEYYDNTIDKEKGLKVPETFRFDLEMIIDFLKRLSKNESVKFHYF